MMIKTNNNSCVNNSYRHSHSFEYVDELIDKPDGNHIEIWNCVIVWCWISLLIYHDGLRMQQRSGWSEWYTKSVDSTTPKPMSISEINVGAIHSTVVTNKIRTDLPLIAFAYAVPPSQRKCLWWRNVSINFHEIFSRTLPTDAMGLASHTHSD